MAILPIVTYDDPVLRSETEPIRHNSDELQQLIKDMFDTMYHANGVGLAAPQIGKSIRIFVMDAEPMTDDEEDFDYFGPSVFINPEIKYLTEETVDREEGCLSIPSVTEMITRKQKIEVSYRDKNFEPQVLQCKSWNARIILHETDHLHGKLFIDYLSSFKKRLIGRTLHKIAHGNLECDYPLAPKVAAS